MKKRKRLKKSTLICNRCLIELLPHNAYLLPKIFTNPADIFQTLLDFFSYSNIIDIEQLEIKEQKGLVFHDD